MNEHERIGVGFAVPSDGTPAGVLLEIMGREIVLRPGQARAIGAVLMRVASQCELVDQMHETLTGRIGLDEGLYQTFVHAVLDAMPNEVHLPPGVVPPGMTDPFVWRGFTDQN